MAEIRETLRFGSTDLEEMNRVMGRLQDRIDELEGRRGDPVFLSDVNFSQKQLLNVAGLAQSVEAETDTPATPNTFDQETVFNQTAKFSVPPNIPIFISASKPTTSSLPNSGDIAIWQINATNNRLVVNIGGLIFQMTFVL